MIGKFTGLQVFALGIALGVGLLVFVSLSGSQIGFLTSLGAAAVIPFSTMIVLLTLVRGKPKGYFSQWLEWWRLKKQGLSLLEREPAKSKTATVKDGFISHGLIVLEGKAGKATVSCGLEICCPAMESSSVDTLNDMEDRLRGLIRQIPKGWMMQICWRKGGGYEDDLRHFYEDTEKNATSPWSRRQRNERFVRSSREDEEGSVTSSRVRLFLKAPLNLRQITRGSESSYDEALRSISRNFEAPVAEIKRVMSQLNGRARLLNDEELFEEANLHFNPGSGVPPEWKRELSLFENILSGEVVPVVDPEAGFFLGGRYHSSLALSQLPEVTASGIITHLTNLPEQGFQLSTHLETLDPLSEIEKAESMKAKLERARQSSHHSRLDYDIRILNDRIQRLSSGAVSPVRVQVLVHVSAENQSDLKTRMKALVGAVSGMKSAKFYEVALPTTCRNIFLAGLPGSPYREPAFWHLVDDPTAVNLIPICGDSNESLKGAEALYRGRQGNLIGVSGFHGKGERKSPKHALFTGRTGSGKSVHGIDFLTQIDAFAHWRVVIDNGRSFETSLNLLSGGKCRSFAPDVNGIDTLNYVDTLGLPLTSLQVSRIVAVIHLMVGHKNDEDQDSYRRAILNRCLQQFYRDWIDQWLGSDLEKVEAVVTRLAQLRLFQKDRNCEGDLAEVLSALIADEKGEASDGFSVKEELLNAEIEVVRNEGRSADFYSMAVAFLDRENAPRHRNLHDWMLEQADTSPRDRDEIAMLATLLEPWRADSGMMGCLFDGVNTIDLSADYVHIELGLIENADPTVKSLVSHIITSQILGEIIRRPRSERKHVLIEELGAFINIEGGKKIIQDLYERARKYNTLVITVIQQVSRLPEDLARTVVGNSGQGCFFMQREPGDVALLQKLFELPDAIVKQLRDFKMPDADHGASYICWEHLDDRVQITPAVNMASREMLYAADSHGTFAEQRKKALAGYSDPMTGVLAELAKQDLETSAD
ncbi:MAG: hypothetical protein ACJAQT_000089 [Akkermansiaceae bacterium]|jgi:hypothetical protein